MAPVIVDPRKVREFEDFQSFYDWLAEHHDKADEVWIKMHKAGSGLKSVNAKEAIDAVLCWGWIDAIRKGLDDKSFLQRYTLRGRKSVWSKINVDNVARLEKAGLMTDHGRAHVLLAKADGRWDNAYGSGKDLKIPADLQAAIDAEPAAKGMLGKLTEQNRFALAFRMHNIKTPAGREKKIKAFVDMLKAGETIYPQKAK
ncbi:YdeI/OmpD-associated family protein [Devosia sp. CN2-171]|uniref:YdeI/OmpD-associated family protein n=1 Tax=Devosia sp. CN2-171 TaxID=3400909 RepID=UPI003BF82694